MMIIAVRYDFYVPKKEQKTVLTLHLSDAVIQDLVQGLWKLEIRL